MSNQRAHPDQHPVSLADHFLIATPVIGGGFFSRSLTYLCHHDEQGAMGIVVNHCLDVELSDLLNQLDIESLQRVRTHRFWPGTSGYRSRFRLASR